MGGAGFLFIVTEADEQGGYAAAERLRKALHSAYQRQVSASFGVQSSTMASMRAEGRRGFGYVAGAGSTPAYRQPKKATRGSPMS